MIKKKQNNNKRTKKNKRIMVTLEQNKSIERKPSRKTESTDLITGSETDSQHNNKDGRQQ